MIFDFCVACGEREASLENHHLVPRSAGGSDNPKNLITLCFDCHGKAHGYQRRDIRKLVRDGLAAAKAGGKKLGNPRPRDPETRRKLAVSRKARYLNEINPSADKWLPIVEQMRPKHGWWAVVAAIKEQTGQVWSEERLRRAVKYFVSEGLLDAGLLKKASPSRARNPRAPSRASAAVQAVADMVSKNPGITIPDLARRLEAKGVQKPGGSAQWSKPSTVKFVEQARTLGLL